MLKLVKVPSRSVSFIMQIGCELKCLIDMLLITICSIEQYFGLKEDQVPLIVIQTSDGQKYLKPNLGPDQISLWVKEYEV